MKSENEWQNQKLQDLEDFERSQAFEQNGGATKKNRKKFSSNMTPKTKKRKRK